MSRQAAVLKETPDFHLRCDAAPSGTFETGCSSMSVTVGQRISRADVEQMWDFVLVLSRGKGDGTLVTRVLLCYPEWSEPLEIASVESSPHSFNLRVGETNCGRNKR